VNRICAVFCDSMGNVVKFNHLAEVLPDRCEIVNGRADFNHSPRRCRVC
jgi:hypothetical protein